MDYLFITAPENIAWILNIRGGDSEFSPIPNARLLINNKGEIYLFSQLKKIEKIKKKFLKEINFFDENKIENKLRNIRNKNIWIDNLSCSVFFKNLLSKKIEL